MQTPRTVPIPARPAPAARPGQIFPAPGSRCRLKPRRLPGRAVAAQPSVAALPRPPPFPPPGPGFYGFAGPRPGTPIRPARPAPPRPPRPRPPQRPSAHPAPPPKVASVTPSPTYLCVPRFAPIWPASRLPAGGAAESGDGGPLAAIALDTRPRAGSGRPRPGQPTRQAASPFPANLFIAGLFARASPLCVVPARPGRVLRPRGITGRASAAHASHVSTARRAVRSAAYRAAAPASR